METARFVLLADLPAPDCDSDHPRVNCERSDGLRSVLPGPEYTRPDGLIGTGLIGALLAAAFLDQGGVLEELGWRGFALHELQAGSLSPLGEAVLVGIAWGLWHVPRDVTWGVVERLGLF